MANKRYVSGNGVSSVPFERRVLLLPYCLRPSRDCPGEMTRQGLNCGECQWEECAIYQLRSAAEEAGYQGVCVAPGGRLVLRYLVEQQPEGVVAIGCDRELEDGREAMEGMKWQCGRLHATGVPLLENGCVDTVVDLEAARSVILEYDPTG
jgi:geranylgeranyl diphosphate synthase type II